MVEAKIALAMLLRAFSISDPHSYKLAIKETLSIKPDNFWMRIRLRQPHERLQVAASAPTNNESVGSVAGTGQRFAVLFGTSLGTARDVAEEIAERARLDGFDVVVRSLDESFKGGTGPQDKVIVIVTATYNGRAPDSAIEVERALDAGAFADADWAGAHVAILGVGNSQWPNYQAFPKRIALAVEKVGATMLVPRAEADGQGDFDSAVAGFVRDLWRALGANAGPSASAASVSLTQIDPAEARAGALPGHAQQLTIVANGELVKPADGLWDFAQEPPRSSTRLLRIALPAGQAYHTGDHMAVYARNRSGLVDRAIARLGLDGATQLRVEGQGGRFKHLPLGRTVTLRQLLTDFVELSDPLPRRALGVLAAETRCPDTKAKLAALEADYDLNIAAKRVNLLDLLDTYPAVEISLDHFVELSAPIAPRFYSIASSPRVAPDAVDLIVGTMAAPAWSGLGEHRGFASNYMGAVAPGDYVFGYVRRPNPPFAPPEDPSVPTILIGPDTGFAPLRGFLQERAAQRSDGADVAISLLFFGCRHPHHDWFCRDEMESWAVEGLVDLNLAFSALPNYPSKFVQDALWAEWQKVWETIEAGASIYLCGDGRFMAPAVRDTLIRIRMLRFGEDHAAGSAWLETMIDQNRFHQDVFGFGK